MSQFLDPSQWIFIGVLLVCLLVLDRALHWLVGAAGKHFGPEAKVWRHALLTALDLPLRVVLWLIGAIVAVRYFVPLGSQPQVDRVFLPAIDVLLTLIVTWFMLRAVKRVKSGFINRSVHSGEAVDKTAVDAIAKLSWVVVLIIAVLTVLKTLGIPLAGLLAFGGAAGIAVGFAAQTLVSNLFGGLTVFASRIFKIGEAIVLPGTGLAGNVENIGWRSTLVQGWDGKPFFIPNSVFNTTTVINHTRMTHRTISENVLLRYEDFDKVEAIVREGNELLDAREDIGYYMFRFDSFGEQSLKLAVYAYALTDAYAEFMRIKEEVLLAIAGIARAKGCQLVLPLHHYRLDGRPSSGPDPAIDMRGGHPATDTALQ